MTMADAHARFKGLGVALTSTGAGAGNAVGSLIEAMNAGSPVLHLTGQVEREYLDRDASFIHETKDQLTFYVLQAKRHFVSPAQIMPLVSSVKPFAWQPQCQWGQ